MALLNHQRPRMEVVLVVVLLLKYSPMAASQTTSYSYVTKNLFGESEATASREVKTEPSLRRRIIEGDEGGDSEAEPIDLKESIETNEVVVGDRKENQEDVISGIVEAIEVGRKINEIVSEAVSVEIEALESSERRNGPKSRKFVSYSSSDWELLWLDHISDWEDERKICDILTGEHAHYVHDMLNTTCTSRMPEPYQNWCILNDDFHALWYNSDSRDQFILSWTRPPSIPETVPTPQANPVIPGPEHSHIMSKFVFYDEIKKQHFVEYIEPLVSHLRFPLSNCIKPFPGTDEFDIYTTLFRGWLLPPPASREAGRTLYFDVGAKAWDQAVEQGGPSIKYFTSVWSRYGILFDSLYVFDQDTKNEEFYATVPLPFQSKTHFKQCPLSASPVNDSKELVFVPKFINENSEENDYVALTIDVESPEMEMAIVQSILSDPGTHVDELTWEHHVKGNYFLQDFWRGNVANKSLRDSYEVFLKLRQRGIRAHSWV